MLRRGYFERFLIRFVPVGFATAIVVTLGSNHNDATIPSLFNISNVLIYILNCIKRV